MKKIFTLIAVCVLGVMGAMADTWSIDYKAIYAASIKADKTTVTLTDDGTISGYSAPSANDVDLSNGKFYIANGKSWLMRPGGLYSFNSGSTNVALKGCKKNQTITLVYTGAAINSASNTTTVTAGVYKVSEDGDVIISVARYGYFEKITIEDPTAGDFDYVVKNSFGDILAKGTSNPTKDPVIVTWSKYIQKEGKWYGTNTSGIAISEATDMTVEYTEADIDYFIEAENMTKSRSAAATLNGVEYSNGVSPRHYSNSYWWTAPLEGGTYTMTAPYKNNNKSGTVLSVYYRNADGNLVSTGLTFEGTTGARNATVENILIPEGCSLVIYNNNSYNSNVYIDYITLKKTGDATLPVAVNESKTASLVAPCALDFTGSTLKAYVATEVSESAITLEEVTTVAAGQAIVVKGESCDVNVIAEAAAPAVNLFQSGAMTVAAGENVYALSKADGQFHKVDAGVAIPEGKAYIVAGSTSAKTLALDFGGEATGISNATVAKQNTAAFNLMGQKVNANAKGIVIINGKKFNNK